MKRQFTFLFVLVALLVSISVTPVWAADDKGDATPDAVCGGWVGWC